MGRKFCSYYLDSPIVTGRCFDVFEPEKITRDTAVFFIHGGGWIAGSRTTYHKIMQFLNARGWLCASTDYRLASTVRYRSGDGITAIDQLKDIREAYDKFVSILKERALPLKIAVFGSSAGAHLTSLLATADPGECGEKVELVNPWVKPVKAILQATPTGMEPWEDIFPQGWEMMQGNACGWRYEENPEIFRKLSMTTYLRSDNPPCFFIEAGNEHIFPPQRNLEVVDKQRQMGIASFWKLYPSAEHGFVYDVKTRIQQEALSDMMRFLNDEPIPGALTGK